MRIAAHAGAMIWGGAERAVVKLLADLASRGHELRLLCNASVVLEGAREALVPALRHPGHVLDGLFLAGIEVEVPMRQIEDLEVEVFVLHLVAAEVLRGGRGRE